MRVGNKSQCIHEAHRLVKVFEGEGFLKRTIKNAPAQCRLTIEFAQLRDDFGGAEGTAVLMSRILHNAVLAVAAAMRASRSEAGGWE